MNKIEQFHYDVLEKLREAFDKLELAAIVRGPEDGAPTHMLNVLHTEIHYSEDEILGEYFFLPIEEENAKFHVFTSMLTLTENMPEDKYSVLSEAVNILNFMLPVGAFVFSKPESIMAFKYTSLIPMKYNEEEVINAIDGNIGMSIHITTQYLEILMQLMRGETDFAEFEKTLPDAYRIK